jgi:hypothetical protein
VSIYFIANKDTTLKADLNLKTKKATVHKKNSKQCKCPICGDERSSYLFYKTYGVSICKPCHNFFSNNNSLKEKCKRTGSCLINIETRAECRPCRLKKCLEMGMSI